MTKHEPSPTEPNGRNPDGTFAKGNKAAKGNPLAQRVGKLRSAMLAAVDDDDMRAIVTRLIVQARGGDVAAAKVLLDRVFGPPVAADVLERIERLETDATLGEWHGRNRFGAETP